MESDPDLSITNHHFAKARLNDLFGHIRSVVGDNEKKLEEQFYAAMASVWGMLPKDHAEARMLVQMRVIHDAAIQALIQVERSKYLPQTQTFGNLATKLLRTYQGQMESLAGMRRGTNPGAPIGNQNALTHGDCCVHQRQVRIGLTAPDRILAFTPGKTSARNPHSYRPRKRRLKAVVLDA